MFSLWDLTNDSKVMNTLFGHRTCCRAFSSGGYDECQAEWVRVPFADVNLLKMENNRLADEEVHFF